MSLRPAGMSDDEDDEDDFYFSDTPVKTYNYSPKADFPKKEVYDFNYMQDNDERQILESRVMNACIKGQLDVIEEYLEKHDINQFIYTGWSLLLYATSSMQLEVIEYLLAHGANPNMHKDGFTPLMALCSSTKGLSEISLKCLTLLIEAKADVNATSKMRETPLMYACKSQSVEFVVELLKHVKNINACDSDGRTALSYAVTCNKADIVAILLEHNADTTVIDRYNLTAKDIADAKDFTEISALLPNEDEGKIYCELSQVVTWKDLFPELYPRNKEILDHNISIILHGMGLEKYNILFRGMSLKTFLQLTEDDLCHLGIDITVYREQFLENLHKFHCQKWKADSVGIIKKTVPYTIYDAAMSLANIKLQIGVIASSFQHIKNLMKDISLDPAERVKYEEQIKKTQNTLKILKNEINGCRKLAREIDKKNGIGLPASFLISPEKRKNRTSWVISLSVTLIIGLYIYKTMYVHRL